MSAPRSPYRQTHRQSTGSRRRESNHPIIPPEKARTSGYSAREELPVHNGRQHRAPPPGSKVRVKPSGESGRRGFHPFKFLKITWKSSSRASLACNFFWPVVPAAFVVRSGDQFTVIKAAILGSILATMLLCLGLCFIAGGMRRDEAEFSETVSEAGSGLLLTAYSMAKSLTVEELDSKTLHISRIVSVLLVIAYGVFVWFQARTHHGIYDAIFEHDEQRDHDKRKDINKPKLTLTECVIALVISITLVTFMAIYLVEQIHPIVLKHGISDHFMGLILVPLVEKAAEHLTAVDEAWDNQMNFALSHVLGATLQTALLNGPLVVIVAWGLHKHMDIVFEVFDIGMLILSILTVGNFLRDQKSNYLEGFLCVIVYLAIAVAAFYYPNPQGLGEH
ncbi:Ca2+ transporter [Colletotrichum tofieldiae]|nr:Ca2+ transporter [Colletotrichum tofieldiae]